MQTLGLPGSAPDYSSLTNGGLVLAGISWLFLCQAGYRKPSRFRRMWTGRAFQMRMAVQLTL